MSLKRVLFYVTCALAWFVLLPILLVGGTTLLVTYAVVSKLHELSIGRPAQSVDHATARELARRLCLGH